MNRAWPMASQLKSVKYSRLLGGQNNSKNKSMIVACVIYEFKQV